MEFDDDLLSDSEYSSLESEVDLEYSSLESEVDSDSWCDSELDPDWDNHVLSWEELVAKALHVVRLHQITEYVQCSSVRTRFCKYNLAYFDFDKESQAKPGTPLLELTSHQHSLLEESINVLSLKILQSDVGYPIKVFGTVLVRDQVDYKCVYLFRRYRDDPQVINSPEDSLKLIDPCRGLAVTSSMFFEINLMINDDACGEDKVLSKGVIEHDTCISNGEKLMTEILTSWHSTVELAYTPVPYAVTATLSLSMLHGASHFTGEVIAWTSKNENKIILHDSKVAGTSTELGAGGSVALTRRLVAVPVDEKLVLRISVRDAGGDAECLEFTLGRLHDQRTCFLDSYELRVDVEWTGILSTMREDVYELVGHTRLLL